MKDPTVLQMHSRTMLRTALQDIKMYYGYNFALQLVAILATTRPQAAMQRTAVQQANEIRSNGYSNE